MWEKGRLGNISGVYPEIHNAGISPGDEWRLAPRRSIYERIFFPLFYDATQNILGNCALHKNLVRKAALDQTENPLFLATTRWVVRMIVLVEEKKKIHENTRINP